VYTVLSTDAVADGQANTVHFNYLLRDHGGFVSYAPDLATHVAQLADGLSAPADTEGIRTFIGRFLRPLGNRPVAPALAEVFIDRADRHRDIAAATDAAAGPTNHQPTMLDSEPVGDTAAWPVDETARATYRLGGPVEGARLYATAITRRSARHGAVALPPALDAWLASEVTPGDVLYDVGAGAGACAIFAALQRGAAVVAFEPGFDAFRELCENLILNRCGRSVIPLPVALADRAGLRALTYPHVPGSDRHALRDREWRLGGEAPSDHYTQPVAAEPLDEVVRRQKLPPPQALRIAVRSGADAVLRGAAEVLAAHRPRSILVILKDPEQTPALLTAAVRLGYQAEGDAQGPGPALRLVPAAHGPRSRPWGGLRKAAGRVRAGG
jgi:FkbM family methyltransferase